jgi:outer membrane biosynthesis protein TonB
MGMAAMIVPCTILGRQMTAREGKRRSMKRFLAAMAITGLLSVMFVVPALAAKPSPDHKVQLCHRTASDTNPYALIEVDETAVDTHLNNGQGHPAKENEDGSPRNDFLYVKGEAECEPGDEEPTPTPEVTPTPTPKVTPTPEVTPTPVVTPEVTPTLPMACVSTEAIPCGPETDVSTQVDSVPTSSTNGLLFILGVLGLGSGLLILRKQR